ncbi:MAG: radical SAM protein [Roseburia sp.]|nr:radical SAM protein [Roseburia sp.]
MDFRNLWDAQEPSVADIRKIERKIAKLPKGTIIRLGGMTDCFQPCEREYGITKATIELLNRYGIEYLIVTKSDLVCEYMNILDKQKAHIQVSTTWIPCEKAVSTERRIKAIETLYAEGFDVAVRLSPYVPQFVDFERLNSIRCNKIIVEFLRVNHWIKKWLPLDYSDYTVKQSGYQHLPLEKKIEYLSRVTGFDEVSVCEDVSEHYEYWKEAVNHNKLDCCNLRRNEK